MRQERECVPIHACTLESVQRNRVWGVGVDGCAWECGINCDGRRANAERESDGC